MMYTDNSTTVAYKDATAKVKSDYWKRRDELSDTLDSHRGPLTAERAAEIQPIFDAYLAAIAPIEAKCVALTAPFLAEYKSECEKNVAEYDASIAAVKAEYGVY